MWQRLLAWCASRSRRGRQCSGYVVLIYVIIDTRTLCTHKLHYCCVCICCLMLAASYIHVTPHNAFLSPATTSLATLSACLWGGGVWAINNPGYMGGLARGLHHIYMHIYIYIYIYIYTHTHTHTHVVLFCPHTIFTCFYGPKNKQRLFPYTGLTL